MEPCSTFGNVYDKSFEVLMTVRADPRRKQVPVPGATAHFLDRDEPRRRAAGDRR